MSLSSIGIGQWLIILAIIVLLFGAKKIPELAKGLGRGIKTFKSEMTSEDKEKIEDKTELNADAKIFEEHKKEASASNANLNENAKNQA